MRFLRLRLPTHPRSDEVFEVKKDTLSLDLMRFLRKGLNDDPRSDEVFEGVLDVFPRSDEVFEAGLTAQT